MSIALWKCIYTYVCSFLSLGTCFFNAFGIFKIIPLDVSSNLPGFLWPSLVKTKNNCYFIRTLRIVSTYFKSIRSISWNMRRMISIIKYFEIVFLNWDFCLREQLLLLLVFCSPMRWHEEPCVRMSTLLEIISVAKTLNFCFNTLWLIYAIIAGVFVLWVCFFLFL